MNTNTNVQIKQLSEFEILSAHIDRKGIEGTEINKWTQKGRNCPYSLQCTQLNEKIKNLGEICAML